MSRKTIDTLWDRKTRNDINDNFEELYKDVESGVQLKDIGPEDVTFFRKSNKNLFDGIYSQELSYYTAFGEYGYIAVTSSPNRHLMYMEIENGETYTITKMPGGNRFNVMFTNDKPNTESRAYLIKEVHQGEFDSSQKSYTFTNDINAKYLIVQTNIGVPKPPKMQVEKGEKFTGYEPGSYIPNDYLEDEEKKQNHRFNFPINLNLLYRKNGNIQNYIENPGTLSVSDYHDMFDSLISEHNEIASRTKLGDVTGDFPIYKYEIKPPDYWVEYTNDSGGNDGRVSPLPKIVVTTGIHGHERSPSISAFYFFKELLENPDDKEIIEFLITNIHFVFMPLINPYGWTNDSYNNGNGYNLNRQFPPYQEKSSQPEAILVKDELDKNNDMDFFIDFHNMYFRDGYLSYTLTNTDLYKYGMNNIYKQLGNEWAKENPEMPQDRQQVWGYNSISNNGTVGNYVESQLGKSGTLLEVIRENKWVNDGEFGESIARLGLELLVNAILMSLRSEH